MFTNSSKFVRIPFIGALIGALWLAGVSGSWLERNVYGPKRHVAPAEVTAGETVNVPMIFTHDLVLKDAEPLICTYLPDDAAIGCIPLSAMNLPSPQTSNPHEI